MSREQLLPRAARYRHGQLVAATWNSGDWRPGGSRKWEAGDFVEEDPWALAEESPQSLAQQVAAMNRWLD